MANLFADNVEINIQDGQWRLFNIEGPNSITPFFYTVRGMGLLYYTTSFGLARRLPGDVMSADFVRAVVVGYDERASRWSLGLHVSMKDDEKTRFVELVHWPAGDNPEHGTNSHTAGRILAEYIARPLKLFGVKKVPQAQGGIRGTITGPLEAHQRTNVDAQEVSEKAAELQLPISEGENWLGSARDTLTLRVPKDPSGKTGETPAYNQAVIDRGSQTVRLVPPTGLLGAFFGPQGRAIKFQTIRNVELRHSIVHESTLKKDSDGLDVDVSEAKHEYGVYLTLADETLLLAQLTHVTPSPLVGASKTIKMRTLADVSDTNAEMEIARLRYHQHDQQVRERKEAFIEGVALSIAAAMGKGLAVTTVGEV